MTKKEIAQRVARMAYEPHAPKSDGFAIQLFVEAVVINKGVESYTLEEMETAILDYLKAHK